MLSLRIIVAGLLALTLIAQQPESPPPVIRATVNVVVAPVTITDRDGNYINDLKPSDFRLFDNGKPQDIKVDQSFVPISLAVAIQSNWDTQSILPKVQKIGSLLQGVVTGEQGEVAVLAFDHRIQILQDFTTDGDLISKALLKLKAGSSSSRMIDATMEAIRMLSRRPGDRRRVLLLISETRDRSSENKTREALTVAQIDNVIIYTVNINRLMTTLTAKPMPPRPDPMPPAARPMPGNMPATPETVRVSTANAYNSASFVPVFVEIFKQAKAIFVDNPAEVFTKYTGGREYSFISEKDLERAIQKVGNELHSQYVVSYSPNNKLEGGFHEIEVQVLDSTGRPRRDIKLNHRPGYWLAAIPD
jgi:VWFA-related protein